MERMEKERFAKSVYIGECAGSCSVGSPKKRLDVRQARKMVQDRSEWQGFVRGSAWGIAWRMNPQTLMRCHSYGLSQLYEAWGGNLSMAKPTT